MSKFNSSRNVGASAGAVIVAIISLKAEFAPMVAGMAGALGCAGLFQNSAPFLNNPNNINDIKFLPNKAIRGFAGGALLSAAAVSTSVAINNIDSIPTPVPTVQATTPALKNN